MLALPGIEKRQNHDCEHALYQLCELLQPFPHPLLSLDHMSVLNILTLSHGGAWDYAKVPCKLPLGPQLSERVTLSSHQMFLPSPASRCCWQGWNCPGRGPSAVTARKWGE